MQMEEEAWALTQRVRVRCAQGITATGNQSMAGIAESLATYHTYLGYANRINTEVERYFAVTPEDIQRVAQKYYVPEQRVTLYFLYQDN